MCGIVGALTQRDVVPVLMEGLSRLEYRGYDSAGIAVLNDHVLQRVRCEGKLEHLERTLQELPLSGQLGIAHTRWATHGEPVEANAHPHISNERLAVVHNGIIENDQALRDQLMAEGYEFGSATDSEVIAHLTDFIQQNHPEASMTEVLHEVAGQLSGAYAIGLIHRDHPEHLYVMRQGSPLVVGLGVEEYFIASDMLALVPLTQSFIYLEEGDVARIGRQGVQVFDAQGQRVERKPTTSTLSREAVERGGYRHFMQKEIFEQPQAVRRTLANRLREKKVYLKALGEAGLEALANCERIKIVACGTSHNAGLIAGYWFESWLNMPCRVEIASEFRNRSPVVEPNTLFLTISQSGETADTLAALKAAKQYGFATTMTICNVPGSSLVRASDFALMTDAGPEIGVASTKAFTTQVTALLLLASKLAEARGYTERVEKLSALLVKLPQIMESLLTLNEAIKQTAESFVEKQHALFLGRGTQYPLAVEGALKLKEISYIHAEAYPAGELKHGPLALVDRQMPVVVLAPCDHLLEKIRSNMKEVEARGGHLFIIGESSTFHFDSEHATYITMPEIDADIAPLIYALPMQLLAYHVAVLKGTDVDKPRNLAKSVTVE